MIGTTIYAPPGESRSRFPIAIKLLLRYLQSFNCQSAIYTTRDVTPGATALRLPAVLLDWNFCHSFLELFYILGVMNRGICELGIS